MTAQVSNGQDAKKVSAGAIASGTGLGLLAIFMLQNRRNTYVKFLFWSFTWPLWLVILTSAVLGSLVWIGFGIIRRHQRRKARRDAR